MNNYKTLFEPQKIGGMTIKNRIIQTPLEVGMASFKGGPTIELIDYYMSRVRGGVGLICTGICRVNNLHGVTTPRQLSLANGRNIKAFRKMNEQIHDAGGKIIVQLHHPGRQTYSALVGNWPMVELLSRFPGFEKIFPPLVKINSAIQQKLYEPRVVSASAVPCGYTKQKTRALGKGEVQRLVRQFVRAAKRAQAAGFDGLELHASHGYLIQQFLSPAVNHRTDCYGGSFEGRTRFLREIIEGVRAACGKDYPLLVRLTVDEFYPDGRGINLSEGVKIAKLLEELGVDAIDVSSGSYERMNKWLEPVVYEPGWRKHLAAAVKAKVNIPVIAANLIRSPEQAVRQIAEGCQDFIGLGRPLLVDPELSNKLMTGREHEIRRCIQCCRCLESLNENAWYGLPLQCSLNPRPSLIAAGALKAGTDDRVHCKANGIADGKADSKADSIADGSAVVIGAGPAGLQAAITLAERGVDVVVFEKQSGPGGQLRLAEAPPNKDKTGWCARDFEAAALRAGVTIHYNAEADADMVAAEAPDGVIVAAGAEPIRPKLKGSDLEHVYDYKDILSGGYLPPDNSKTVIVGSGMTGLETAEYLVSRKRQVTVIEMAEQAGPGAYFQHLDEALSYLKEHDCKIITGRKLTAIEKGCVVTVSANPPCSEKISGERLTADTVVFAVGSKPVRAAVDLVPEGIPYRLVGDTGGIGRISEAVGGGYKAALDWPFFVESRAALEKV
ncbi:MAG: NAD(P)/FAD-dependent oxidoreductase [Spirochaetales bacterium]|nr:NAD(P)/FAD-dependent oxidoreductase [Spirochaetales bacterium]